MNDGPLSPQGKAAARTMVTLGGPVRDELLGGFEFEFELNTDASLIDQRWNDFDERHERRYGLAIEHLKSRVKGRAYDNDAMKLRTRSSISASTICPSSSKTCAADGT